MKTETDKRRTRYKIDRENAKKLCEELINFLSTDREWFKVDLNENHNS